MVKKGDNMIFYIIGLLLVIYSFWDFKKSFELFLGYKLILVTNITVISIVNLPILTLDMLLVIYYCTRYLLFSSKYQFATKPFPFMGPLLLFICSVIISSFFSQAGFIAEISNIVGVILQNFLLIYMIWQIVDTKNDYTFLFIIITIVILFSCCYGVFEYSISNNPLVEYEATLNSDINKLINYSYMDEISSRGYRVQSIFEHSIGAGINWALYALFVLYSEVNNIKRPLRKISIITMVLCIICIFLTKMRSPLVFFFIATIGCLNFKKKKSYILIFLGVIFLCTFINKFDYANVFFSLLQTNNSIGGSTLKMRIAQYKAGVELWKYSPIWGLGSKFQNIMNNTLTSQLLGMESVWLSILVKYGLLGLISYLWLSIKSIVYLPTHYKTKEIFYISLAYWITYTISSVPGMSMTMYYLFIFFWMKRSKIYELSRLRGKKYKIYFKEWKIIYTKV